jgi:hypothetical protein
MDGVLHRSHSNLSYFRQWDYLQVGGHLFKPIPADWKFNSTFNFKCNLVSHWGVSPHYLTEAIVSLLLITSSNFKEMV